MNAFIFQNVAIILNAVKFIFYAMSFGSLYFKIHHNKPILFGIISSSLHERLIKFAKYTR